MYTLIGIAKLNDVDPQAWLADVLGRIAETPQYPLHNCSHGTGRPSASTIGQPEPILTAGSNLQRSLTAA